VRSILAWRFPGHWVQGWLPGLVYKGVQTAAWLWLIFCFLGFACLEHFDA
jgi:hypothetical protein